MLQRARKLLQRGIASILLLVWPLPSRGTIIIQWNSLN